LRNFGLVISVL